MVRALFPAAARDRTESLVEAAPEAPCSPFGRRAPREHVEMLARFRRTISSSTVMLKDLTPYGARIEGVEGLEPDEAVRLALPGQRPALAFVAWSNAHCAGLEFAEPLDLYVYGDLVRRYALPGERD